MPQNPQPAPNSVSSVTDSNQQRRLSFRPWPRQSCSEALALGLASGPACIAACGPVLVPSLLTQQAGFRPHARYLAAFLSARLLGYLLFAIAVWELGALASMLPALHMLPRAFLMGAVNILLACVLLWYAYSARHACG